MTTPAEICDALTAAKITLVLAADGTARLRGPKPSAELLAAIAAHKPALIAEWERREQVERDRYGRPPGAAGEPPLRDSLLGDAERQSAAGRLRRHDVLRHVVAQGRAVQAWIETRSVAYFEKFDRLVSDKGLLAELAEFTACADLVCWQSRCEWGTDLFDRLAGFAEAGGNGRDERQTPGE